MRRRDFVKGIAGSAIGWPLAARAQPKEHMRRIGVLMSMAADNPEGQARVAAFQQGLQQLGWTDGRNVQIEIRWGAGDPDRFREYAAELSALAPDVILASGGVTMQALQQATRTVPIVFTSVPDPVGVGYVRSLARPGGNATGFTNFEFGIGAKWLDLIKEIAPRVTRVGVLRDPTATSGTGQLGALQAVASSHGVELTPLGMRDADEIEHDVTAFAPGSTNGLIVLGAALAYVHGDLIIRLAARNKLPTVYFENTFVKAGGLASYGPDQIEPNRRAAEYVDRILKGEKPGDLPVQAPTKYVTAINLKTAKALGLTFPSALLARADEVIE
jgi:putative ABC transport system substrate-binding protein